MKNTFRFLAIIALAFTACLPQPIPPEPEHIHQYGAWSVTKAATCSATGVETRTCRLDPSHKETRAIAINPNAHVLGSNSTITKQPTCTETGIGSGICTLNSAHVLNNAVLPINPNAHNWNTGYTTISTATVTTDGIEAITCKHNASHTKENRTLYATGTPGLAFEAIGSTAYRVRRGTVTTGAVNIPAYYRPNASSQYLPVTEIGASNDSYNSAAAFYNTSITTVTFAENSQLKTIGGNAFFGCRILTSITIPAGVMSIGEFAFLACTSLTSITVDAGNPNYSSESGILYNKAKTTLIQAPGAISGTVTIPASVTSIDTNAFTECTSLTSVTFAVGSQLKTIGLSAFHGCTGLTSITIPAGVTSIGGGAFINCTSLTSVTIPSSVTSIGEDVFYYGWTSSQTINVPFANDSAKPAGWSDYWKRNCNAVIKYWNGTTWV